MMQITKAFMSLLSMGDYPIAVVKEYDEINQYLTKADLIVVATAGTVIAERDHLRLKIDTFPSNIGLMGHLLQFEGDLTPYMHEQFFIINTRAFRHLDFKASTDTGLELLRSDEDMHDGHAPLTITLGKNIVSRDMRFGSYLISNCLENGWTVRNFDEEWRYPKLANNYVTLENVRLPTRGYCYPKLNTETFARALSNMEIMPGLDEAQILFISAVKKILNFNVLNVWQYDATPHVSKASKVVCTANGFLGELIAFNSGATELTFYDKNPNNIEFKKYLYSQWDGNNYDTLAEQWAVTNNLAVEPSFDIDKEHSQIPMQEVKEKIFPIWKEWKKSVTVNAVHCDIVNDPDFIIKDLTSDSIIHTSTILNIFPFTAILYDQEKIDCVIDKIKESQAIWIES
jgi:hypothetical protein